MIERKLMTAKKALLVVISAVMIFSLPVNSFAMPSGLRKKNRKLLERYLQALWCGEWEDRGAEKTVITPETLTPERLNDYITPLADHCGWGKKPGEGSGKTWKEADLKNVLMESMGVTEEMADQAFLFRWKIQYGPERILMEIAWVMMNGSLCLATGDMIGRRRTSN